jgi:hypothetical protein
MDDLKLKLILQAKKLYNHIDPCGNKDTLYECFTINENKLIFWFNTKDHSTHMIKVSLENIFETIT